MLTVELIHFQKFDKCVRSKQLLHGQCCGCGPIGNTICWAQFIEDSLGWLDIKPWSQHWSDKRTPYQFLCSPYRTPFFNFSRWLYFHKWLGSQPFLLPEWSKSRSILVYIMNIMIIGLFGPGHGHMTNFARVRFCSLDFHGNMQTAVTQSPSLSFDGDDVYGKKRHSGFRRVTRSVQQTPGIWSQSTRKRHSASCPHRQSNLLSVVVQFCLQGIHYCRSFDIGCRTSFQNP